MWLRRYNVDEAMSDRLSRKRTLTEKNIVIADLKGKLRVERKKSRVLQMRLLQKQRWRDGGDGEGHFVVATNTSVVNCALQ